MPVELLTPEQARLLAGKSKLGEAFGAIGALGDHMQRYAAAQKAKEDDALKRKLMQLQVQGAEAGAAKSAEESAMQKRMADPMSPESREARAAMGRLGVKVPETASSLLINQNYGKPSEFSLLDFKGKQSRDLELAKLGMEKNKNPNKFAFEQLPIENQEQVKDLAKKTANKKSIVNQIDAASQIFDNPQVPEELKIKAGQNLLKVLNSSEGQDAVGAEESKRLGSFLEYKIANFTQPGSFWGRDLDKFTEQVKLKSAELKDALAANEAEVKRLYGGAQPAAMGGNVAAAAGKIKAPGGKSNLIPEAMAGQKPSFTPEDLQALQWAKSNPNDPRSAAILQQLRGKGLK